MDLPPASYDYLVYGREVGESGTPHLQGYIAFKERQRLSKIARWVPRAHWEPMISTPEEASAYCKKDGDFSEEGVLPNGERGAGVIRDRYKDALEAAKSGSIDDIPPGLLLRHWRVIHEIQRYYAPRQAELDGPCGVWIYGPSGAGKTHKAIHDYPGAYRKTFNKYWCNYSGEETVILDDVSPNHAGWLSDFLKHWSDKWAFPAEFKMGAFRQPIRPKTFVVTSQYRIKDIWPGEKEIQDALTRRFKVVHLPFRQVVGHVETDGEAGVLSAPATDAGTTSSASTSSEQTTFPGARLHRQNAMCGSELERVLRGGDGSSQESAIYVSGEDSDC